jgi:hypothetical protein
MNMERTELNVGIDTAKQEAEDIAKIKETNPIMAEILERHAGKSEQVSKETSALPQVSASKAEEQGSTAFVITPAMRNDAKARGTYHSRRLKYGN